MQQREKVDGLSVCIGIQGQNVEESKQQTSAYLVCMDSRLHCRERGNVQGPNPGHGLGLFRDLVLRPKPIIPADYVRTIPRRKDGASSIWAPAQILREIVRRGTVREGVEVRQIYGVVTADAVCAERFMGR